MSKTPTLLIALAAACSLRAGAAAAQEIRLADQGRANCVIVAPAGWADDAAPGKDLPRQAVALLKERRDVFRGSIEDLAAFLGRMSGTTIDIVEGLPAGERRVPIYVGAAAEKVFGPVGISKAGLFGFRLVADARRGIGLYGESESGTSYAIYELLHRLGCRWFMPTDLGEVVPERPTLAVPAMDEKRAPATLVRTMTQGGADFLRRNRMNRGSGDIVWLVIGDGSLERFFTPQDLEAHPDWRALDADGRPHRVAVRVTHPGVADHVADKILAQLDEVYPLLQAAGLRPGFSLTPFDGQMPTEDPFERPHDPEPRVWEPAAGRWSVTDRCMLMHDRIARRVRAKYPDVAFGDYLYVNKTMPPARQAVPPDFRAMLAPIDFNRHHPMTWPDHVNEDWLLEVVRGWNKAGARMAFRGYGINLAELSAPCPFITKWGIDIAILLENNLQDWVPETMNGWDSMLPGYVLAARMTFDPREQPAGILADLWTKFYGAAAEPMARYWTGIDRAYLEAREYGGSPYGYLKIFTPQVMQEARGNLDGALAACTTPLEYRRVKLIDESFGLFELYMQMRNDWAAGNVRSLETDYATWRSGITDMQRRYRTKGLDHVQGRHGNPKWSDRMVRPGYEDGSRMEQGHMRLGKPLVEWKWRHNPGPEADALPWTKPDHDDADWPTTHVVRDTWSSLGHHFSLTDAASGRSGRMAYRTTLKQFARLPADKKAYLWIGSTDGTAQVFVNGTPIPYVNPDSGVAQNAFDGYCKPARFDVTAALVAGDNQVTILCERHHLNELGTGGLLGPVVLFRDR